MKYLFGATLALCFSMSAMATNYTLISGDGSKYSELCIASAISEKALSEAANLHGVYSSQVEQLSCNGLSIEKFASKYGSSSDAGKIQKVFALTNANDTNETKLCVAAATSNEEFSKVKSELFGKRQNKLQHIACNDLQIASFARKYGNAAFRI